MAHGEQMEIGAGSITPEGVEPHKALSFIGDAVEIDLGEIEEVTLGSSASGNADANSQYYWG